jgi:HD-like signal output (HDOD) protein
MTISAPINQAMDSMRIPTLPASVERIRALLANRDVSMPEVVKAFLQDPPLAAKALKIANSVHYGLRTQTTSIQMAIPVLGLRTLAIIVLRAGVLSLYADTKSSTGFSVQDFWTHSILTGQVSEDLARRCRRRATDMSPQDYYTCGLLHDLGKIVLYDNLGETYVDVIRNTSNGQKGLEAEESRLFGMSHADVGAIAAQMWRLPESIVGIIRCHHRPEAMIGMVEIVKTVTCADEIANAVAAAPQATPKAIMAEISTCPGGLSEEELLKSIAYAREARQQIEL